MTRRKFIQKLVKASAAIFISALWLTKKAVPRKFVRAIRLDSFPGHIKSLHDISKQNKWSG
jgi:hypothetical protein